MRRALAPGAALLCLVAATLPAPARAQAVDLTRPSDRAVALAELRLELRRERLAANTVLLGGGLGSLAAGGVVASVGYETPFWLAFGLGTAGWGLVNAVASLFLLDLDGADLRAIGAGRALRDDALADAREEALRREHHDATILALNLGLDVFYVGSAVLLFLLGPQIDDVEARGALEGYAVAQMTQGGWLMAFDLIGLLMANGRAGRIADLPAP